MRARLDSSQRLANVTIIILYRLHSSICAGESLCYLYSNCTETVQDTTAQVPTTSLPLVITVWAVVALLLGVILVVLIVCTVALVVCLKRKHGRMKREGKCICCIFLKRTEYRKMAYIKVCSFLARNMFYMLGVY